MWRSFELCCTNTLTLTSGARYHTPFTPPCPLTHSYKHTHTQTNTHTHTHTHTDRHTQRNTHTHTRTHTDRHTQTHRQTHTQHIIYSLIQDTNVLNRSLDFSWGFLYFSSEDLRVCVCVCVFVCVSVCLCLCLC